MHEVDTREAGIPGLTLPGPYPVGKYAEALRRQLRDFARVQLIGEVVNLRMSKARAYFELRDAGGAVPCAVWMNDWDKLARAGVEISEGAQVVVAGGCDYYTGSATSSPSFSFSVSAMRAAGEGDLLAQIERLRRALAAEGVLDRQKTLTPPRLPRTIGVICSESGKARHDILAGLGRRGWAGRLVWGFAPVQDRHAAPRIATVLQQLSSLTGDMEVDVIVIARGGGSLADLMCFSDETLCRTVAMVRTPVIASVGHHSDRTLLDDVAAVSCSTPTHAAEAAVPVDCDQARLDIALCALNLHRRSRRAVLARARSLVSLCRAPTDQLARQRLRLHQQLREARAAAHRRIAAERRLTSRRASSLLGKANGAAYACKSARPAELARLALALDAHDPQRTLRRGYALVESRPGKPITDTQSARVAQELRLRFADGTVDARVDEDG